MNGERLMAKGKAHSVSQKPGKLGKHRSETGKKAIAQG